MLSVRNLDQRDLVLAAEGNNQLLVCLLLASLVEDTHVSLASVEGLGGFTEPAGETVVHESGLENTLQGVENGHLTLGCGISGDFDFVGDLDGWGLGLFCIMVSRRLISKGLCVCACPEVTKEGGMQ